MTADVATLLFALVVFITTTASGVCLCVEMERRGDVAMAGISLVLAVCFGAGAFAVFGLILKAIAEGGLR